MSVRVCREALRIPDLRLVEPRYAPGVVAANEIVESRLTKPQG